MEKSFKEKRVRSITHLYYSNSEVQKAIFEFSKDREVCPRYFEGFGKRPDSFQYLGDVFEMVKKGATSFHCSEEIWEDPMKIETGMDENKFNELRKGWDLLIDIDSKYIDYSKIMALEIIRVLNFHKIKNIGIKFSGSKGFHLIIPWKSFPKEVNGVKTSDMFPEWPRIITKYITEKVKLRVTERINALSIQKEKYPYASKYIKIEGITNSSLLTKTSRSFSAGDGVPEMIGKITQGTKNVNKEVMPDLVLVSPRHLFRMPYSLHEKTALASVVLTLEELENFDLKHADPLKVEVRDFCPEVKEGEASELLMQALDWYKDNSEPEKPEKEFKPIKLSNLSEDHFPPCVKKILGGLDDGRQRSVFVLINFFRSLGMDKEEVEKRLYDWNEKNKPPLKSGVLKTQLTVSYKRKSMMPPNCKEYYQGLGICQPDNFCGKIKNPVNYTVRKNLISNKK